MAGSGNFSTGAFQSYNRDTLRTLSDDYIASPNSILTISADLTFNYGDNLAFLALRTDGLKQYPYNEPTNGLVLRLHNFQDGHTGIGHTSFAEYDRVNPGNSFYYNTVNVLMVDNGSVVDVTLKNLTTGVTHSFSHESTFFGGGYVAFSTDNATWDNISIDYTSTASSVPLTSSAALFALGALGFKRRLNK